MIKSSVIICTFNHLPYLRVTLPSIYCQSVPNEDYDIIVVNDGSKDDTKKYLDDFVGNKNTNVTIIHNLENLGLAKSRNVGASKAKSNLLLFLDDDNVADYELIHAYVKSADEYPNCLLQGHQIFPNWILRNNFARTWASWVVPGNKNLELKNISAKNVCPGNFAVPKLFFDKISGFNEKFHFWGLEDGEFTYRLLKQFETKLQFVDKAKTYHIDECFTYSVYLRKYKSIGRNALPILREQSPGFLKLTNYHYIEDIKTTDPLLHRLIKILLHIYFYSPLPFFLEKTLLLVDDIPWLNIFGRFYKLGLSYSVWKGYREYKRGKKEQKKWY